jgi:hypothetical protein
MAQVLQEILLEEVEEITLLEQKVSKHSKGLLYLGLFFILYQ